ncbi:M48 family metalloprotease [Hymenobacter sp. GOD-10R]|uniref:M48 family metalloprotease n=1 Tax=Hymenobacter sp. GOD-10R TaxID=3093922 RepID=UPI002D776EB3|nr:M48 family metalloprotease [Hymenobacter sp. GOD-10R]WRQ26321.1 M48 family metalloprotease [Hymenobacter sp. GOD-10R]
MQRPFLQLALFFSLIALIATGATTPHQGFSLFSIEDDKALGNQVAAQTDSTYRAKGQLLDRNSKNARAYQLLDGVVNRVLNSGQITYRTQFPWDVKIIKDDATQNAFATPGGHIYVFSGLIKYLDQEDQLAGVIGHEIAHADRRHSIKSLQKQYGVSFLLSIALGKNPGQLAQIAAGLGQLKFSRDYEREADSYSVAYLKATNYYSCDGTAGFFIKAEKAGQSNPPEFLSTHPNPGSRIANIQAKAKQLGCTGRSSSSANLTELKKLL